MNKNLTGLPALQIICDSRNKAAKRIAKKLSPLRSKRPDIILVMGGDGTMLRAIHTHWRRGIPFLGINFGHRGYLLNHLAEGNIEAFLRKKFIPHKEALLSVAAVTEGGKRRRAVAFNDAYVDGIGQVGWIEVSIDGRVRLKRVQGDGALVATPAGSTAYAKSMGARPVPIGTNVLVLAFSNVMDPSSLQGGHNLSHDATIRFRNADKTLWHKLYAFADGKPLGAIQEMTVKADKSASVTLLFANGQSLKHKLMELQFPKHKPFF